MAEQALDGLRQVMMVKSYVVLPYLIPQVIYTYTRNTKYGSIDSRNTYPSSLHITYSL